MHQESRFEISGQQDLQMRIPAVAETGIKDLLLKQKLNREYVGRTGYKERIQKLERIKNWIFAHQQDIRVALYEDLRKPVPESDLMEIYVVISEIRHIIRHLKKWMKPVPVQRMVTLPTASAYMIYEARGNVLIISPWNYPFMLATGPLVSAIAAGNCIVLKPSELAPQTSRLIKLMVTDLFPEEEVAVREGDKEVATELLQYPFDHVFFTGSTRIGKIVMHAAAKTLASLTLELGGKSPVIVDETAEIKDAARKICWGKFINCGQSCVAPDYILVHESKYSALLAQLKQEIEHAYAGEKGSLHYSRVINAQHYTRLMDMLAECRQRGATIECGGEGEEQEFYIEPTLLTGVPLDSTMMNEEIFGPLLPVLKYNRLEEALDLVNRQEKPLALYIFSRKEKNIKEILARSTAGGTCINDTVSQFIHLNLPFGGVGQSGMGSAHGFFGFKTFSHERAILHNNKYSPLRIFYPPYTPFVEKCISILMRYF
jgi:aldehyde dehydrogenase (NAD+)